MKIKNFPGELVGTFEGIDIYSNPQIPKETILIIKQPVSQEFTEALLMKVKIQSILSRLWKLGNPRIMYKKA